MSAINSQPATPTPILPQCTVAVVIERRKQPNAWEAWQFRIADVVIDEGGFGETPRVLRDDGHTRQTLYPGLSVRLHRDEAEGYYLNLSSGAPVWFVMWRADEADPPSAWPETVTLSYNEAGRMLDAQERVDNRPLPPPLCAWLQAFVDEHHKPEPKQRRRPASFKPPGER